MLRAGLEYRLASFDRRSQIKACKSVLKPGPQHTSFTDRNAAISGVTCGVESNPASLNLNAAGAGEAAGDTQWPIEVAINAACAGVAPGPQRPLFMLNLNSGSLQ